MRETQNSHRTHGKRQSTGFASRCVNAPLKLSEMPAQPEYLDDDDNEGDGGSDSVAAAPCKLGHVAEIHAIPAGEQRKGQKQRRDDGQQPHDAVLTRVLLGLIKLAQLQSALGDKLRVVLKPLGSARELFPCGAVVDDGRAELVGKPLADIRKLSIVRAELGELLAMPGQTAEEIVWSFAVELGLHALKLGLDVHHVQHVVFDQKLQQPQKKLRRALDAGRVLYEPAH